MVTALDRKLWRDLIRLKGQVLTIALVVAAGIAAYVTLRSTWASLTQSRDTYYERYRFADVFANLKRAPESVARRIEDIPGVAVVHTRVAHNIMLPMPGMSEPANGRVISVPNSGEPPLNALYIRSGRMPDPGRTDEVVVVESFATAHELEPGDQIPAVLNGAHRQLRVVGIALSPEYIFVAAPGEFAPDNKRYTILWMNRDVIAPAFQMEGGFNDVVLRLQPGASERAVISALDDILRPYGGLGAVPRAKQMSNFLLEGELTQLQQFALVFPLIFLAVAAFLLNVVLSRLVNLQRQQIAVLKAVGYRDRRIALHYLELVSIIVVSGAILGVVLGAELGEGMTNLYGRYFRFPTKLYHLDASIAAIAIIVSLFAAVVGALGSMSRVAKMPPAEAMRPPAPPTYRVSLIDRLGISKILGPSGTMVLREIRRRPWRMVLSCLGIAAALGILIMGRFGYDSFTYLYNTVIHEQQRADTTVAFHAPIPARAARELVHLPGVLDSEGSRTIAVRFHAKHRHRDAAIEGIPSNPRLRRVVDRNANHIVVPKRGLAISKILGQILHVKVGDELQVEVLEGNRGTYPMTVALLVDDAFGILGYMNLGALHRVLGQERAFTSVNMRTDPRYTDEIQRRLKQLPRVAVVTRKVNMIQRMEEQSGETMLVMSFILTGFAMVIAIGVVYNNARVALSMRSRDLSSMRVLGFTRREISTVLLGELAIQVIVAIPIGLVLGKAWANAVMSTVDPETYRMPVYISPGSYMFSVLVIVAAGIVSALLVRRKLDKLDLIAVLKTRE